MTGCIFWKMVFSYVFSRSRHFIWHPTSHVWEQKLKFHFLHFRRGKKLPQKVRNGSKCIKFQFSKWFWSFWTIWNTNPTKHFKFLKKKFIWVTLIYRDTPCKLLAIYRDIQQLIVPLNHMPYKVTVPVNYGIFTGTFNK